MLEDDSACSNLVGIPIISTMNETTFTPFFVLSAKYRHHRQSDLAKRLFREIGDNSIAALLLLFLTSSVNSNYCGSEMTGTCLDMVTTHLV